MKNKEYWKKRMMALEDRQYQESVAYFQDVQEQYRRAINETVRDIGHWYQRLADNNGISLASAKRLLKKDELKEFHWSVGQYVKAGQENAVNRHWMKELENASAKYHISYLEAMKLQMQQHAELLATEFEGGITTFLHKSYGDQFYRIAFEVAKGTGVGSNLSQLDARKVELLLKRPWAQDGKNFSDRIWADKEKLVGRLHTELSQCIIRGGSPDKAIGNLSKAMDASRKQAGRLVMTESAAISSRAHQDCFRELGVEEFEVVETLDGITCSFCQEMDGRHFPMQDFRIGETAPPFHPYCRGCTCPYFDENFGQVGERAARDPGTGKTYYVPGDMTYKEWKKTFVDGGDKPEPDVYNQNGVTHWTKKEKVDKIDSMNDITQEWTRAKGVKGAVTERQEYTVDGTTYKVDGKHIILRPTEQEREVAAVLSEKYGKTVEFVPQVMHPQGIQTPDYMIDGDRFDLKSPTGRGKNLLYGMLAKKKRQSPNFIFDITGCPLSEEDIIRQIGGIYASRHTSFVEKIVIFKSREILKVFDRQ